MSKTFPVLYGKCEVVNAVAGAGGRQAIVKHLQPGVVRYENDDGSFTTYLLELDAIAAMRPTAAGIPLVGKSGAFDHVQVEPGKKYDGEVLDSFWDGESGWEAFHVDRMNAETAQACEKGFQASCAYIPTETDGKPGKWHNIDYDEKILNGRYTHVAVVPNPRYEGATIELTNSQGGLLNKTLKAVLAAFMPLSQLKEIVNSIEDDAKKEDALRAEKKNAEAAARKANLEAAMANAKTDEEKKALQDAYNAAEAEAAKGDGVKPPIGGGDVPAEPGLPRMEAPKPGENATDPTAAIAQAEGETLAQEKAEQAALEKKNAEAKAAEEKRLADEKAEQEKTNALTKEIASAWGAFTADMVDDEGVAKKVLTNSVGKPEAYAKQAAEVRAAFAQAYIDAAGKTQKEKLNALAAKAKAAVEARNAAAKLEREKQERFNALRQAAAERGGTVGSPFTAYITAQEKEDLGRERYGSHA